MRRHFRKRPNPCCCTMFKYREQTLVLTLLVSTSFEYFFTSLFSCLPPLAGDMMNMQMSDRSSCIGPMSCLQPPLLRPAHILQSNLSPSLASALSCSLERSFPELSWWSECVASQSKVMIRKFLASSSLSFFASCNLLKGLRRTLQVISSTDHFQWVSLLALNNDNDQYLTKSAFLPYNGS